MKWGVTYNAFDDSHEIFYYSLKCIRPHVDYINVVFQRVSNFGEPAIVPNYIPDLIRWKQMGLIDDLVEYMPSANVHNEVMKRNIGRVRCIESGCDYLMSMDTDELYVASEFEFMKEEMVSGGYDGSACQMLTYYKTSEYIVDPPQEYYVPLMFKADINKTFGLQTFPVLVDPTRNMTCENVRIFSRGEIQMHHFSYVRHDVRRKLRNSTSYPGIRHAFDRMVSLHENFDGQTGNVDGNDCKLLKLEQPFFEITI
jgi:hypothetical protein